jgi:hypothetical protein
MRIGVVVAVVVTVVVAALPTPAVAGPQLEPIQPGQSYAIDLYDGVPLGNSAVIATGGASIADAIGSSGTLVNASASAVRQTTDTDAWNWDYHIDYLIGSLSTDYANSAIDYGALGKQPPDSKTSTITFGGSLRVHDWAGAITAGFHSTRIVDGTITLPDASTANLFAQAWQIKAAGAKWCSSIDMAIGASLDTALFEVKADCPGCTPLFSISGGGLEAGAQWLPRRQSFRVGATLVTPIAGTNVTVDQCTSGDVCMMLPDRVVAAARLGGGIAYRWADTAWNQTVGGVFRDEVSVTALADVVITGSSPDAYGLDGFGVGQLERSGRHAAVSVRGGVEYEWVPGRLRIRGGSYWEPGRFEGVPGRVHGTFGIEVRATEFELWGRRRGRITLTEDLAAGYNNLGLSIGFWH